MALHSDLPIHRTGVQLLALAIKAQEQMPRGVKRSLGDKISHHCVEMLDLMALANATQRGERAAYIHQLMTRLRAMTVLLRVSHDSRRNGPSPTGFAGPLKGAPPAARQSRFRDGRLMAHHASVLHSRRPCSTGIGIGVPYAPAAQSRTVTVAAFLFGQPVSMAARQGSREARRFPLRGCAGTPTLSGCRPDWRRGGSRSTTRTSEANMAPSSNRAQLRLVSAQPATTPNSNLADPTSNLGDLVIHIWPGIWTRYKGTGPQLEAEGVIPVGTVWPKGSSAISWEAGGVCYTLHRTRPAGIKGPMKVWLEGDYWSLTMDVPGRDWVSIGRQNIEQKVKALRDEVHRQSAAGRREWESNWARYTQARNDKAFQAFQSIFVPTPKKRGPKPKTPASDGAKQ